MIKDRIAFDLPSYDGLLAGHYVRGPGYGRRREGGTDDWLLIYTVRGSGRFLTNAGEIFATPDQLILIAPGTTHDYAIARDTDEWEILWVHFHPKADWLDLLQWPLVASRTHILNPHNPAEIETTFRELISLSATRNSRFAMNALERLLLLCEADIPAEHHALDSRIRLAIELIQRDLKAPLSLAELSRHTHLSESRFAHLFRQETGLPPRQYILLQRLKRAKNLLERTTLGVAEVAGEVGMDPFYLTLRFKQETGKPPREYRRTLPRT